MIFLLANDGPNTLTRTLEIVLPTLFLVSVFFSWKLAIIVSVVFLASLVVGAMTEADDTGFH